MCANDILVSGAEPLFFLDYVAIGKLDAEHGRPDRRRASPRAAVRRAARSSAARWPSTPASMPADDYDLSGFCVGVVDRPKLIDGSAVAPGDVILGLASSGLHSNGFSLVRRVLVDGHEAELDAAAARPGRRDARRRAAHADPHLRQGRSCALLRAGMRGQGDGAHHRRRHHREPRPRAARRRATPRSSAGSWPVPRAIELAVEAAALPADEALSHVQHGHRVRARVSTRRRARSGGAPARGGRDASSRSARSSPGEGKVVYR